ncbi:MAG: NupC/NupG family nucleoside CNT transporter [Candidatus Melainabacteria bacterium]|nr:NupC/NupG family nucleoside CNT transporter [Candidatus Melainabacteria bacterium]
MEKLIGLLGIVTILLVAFAASNNRRAISWRLVGVGLGGQLLLALLILKVPGFTDVFALMGDGIRKLLDYSSQGAAFVFGEDMVKGKFVFLIQVGSSIIFMSALSAVAYYLGIMQKVVAGLAWVMRKTMGVSGAEALSSASSIFVGQVESQFLIRPYMKTLTNSELFTAMTVNMATIAGTVLVAYTAMGMNAMYLIAASVMSAPAGIVIAKMMWPETDREAVARQVNMNLEKQGENIFDAFSHGVLDGWKVARNVMIMVLAAVAFIAMANGILGAGLSFFGWSFQIQDIFGVFLTPVALLMGAPWNEAFMVGKMMATEIIVNEFVSYGELAAHIRNGTISAKGQVIATIALCGFANLSSIAINIGGLSAMAPERRGDIARMGFKALVAANMATWLTAAVAGILF